MKFLIHGTQIDVEYTEPSLNTDDTPVSDLHHTSIFYDLGAGPVLVIELLASLNTGGGLISYSFIVPVVAGQEANVNFWATASDSSGNESAPSEVVTLRIDRLAPKAPF